MAQLCFHCHEAIPNNVTISARIDGADRPMCCYGCKAVAETIAESGLKQYYQYRTTPALKAEPSVNEDFTLFDQRAFNREFVHSEDNGLQCADILVDGVSCAACTWLIENALHNQDGLSDAHLNLQDKRLRIRWDTSKTNLSTLVNRVAALGYTPKPYLTDALKDSQRRENRQFLKRLGVAFIGMMQVGMFAIGLHAGDISDISVEYRDYLRWVSALVASPVVFYSAGPFFSNAWRSLLAKSAGMDLPVSIAIGIAYSLSMLATITGTGAVYFDSIIMFTFLLLLGRYIEMRARHQLGDPATALRAILPRSAMVLRDGAQQPSATALADIHIGDLLVIKPGEVIPVDGVVAKGESSVDESTFTGESLPQAKCEGDHVLGGTINIESPLQVSVSHNADNSRLHAVYDMLVNAQANKPKIAAFADAMAVKFVSTILVLAAATAAYWYSVAPDDAIWIALSVLVVSCPCALSLATPTALTAAVTRLKNMGLLVVSGDVIDKFKSIDTVIFDKTGTLTSGHIQLLECRAVGDIDSNTCLALAAAMERDSEHPIARAFYHISETNIVFESLKTIPGKGVEGRLDGHSYRLGQPAFCHPGDTEAPESGQWICLARDEQVIAWFALNDSLRSSAVDAIASLRSRGLRIDILSGDSEDAVDTVAKTLSIDTWRARVTPEDKLTYLRALQSQGHRVLMVGDGINDVGVLAGADLSIAMGMASELAKTNADLILLNPDLRALDYALQTTTQCQRVIKQNIVWALLYNACAIPLAMTGAVLPYQAAIGMSLSSLVVVINALRFKGK
ncbi:MAG: cadmium-translocating P-type ATPase [Pseudomonadota bacterium]